MAHFELYMDNAGKYRWRLRSSGNNKIIAEGGEGYISAEDCQNGINLVKQEAPNATVQRL